MLGRLRRDEERTGAWSKVDETDRNVLELNSSWDPVEVTVLIHANPRLPARARCYLHNGRRLVNALNPEDRTEIVDGSVRVRLLGKTGAVYQSDMGRRPPRAELLEH